MRNLLTSATAFAALAISETNAYFLPPTASSFRVHAMARSMKLSGTSTTSCNRRRGRGGGIVMMPNGPPQVPYKAKGTDYWQFVDIYQRLSMDRVILVGNFIDEEVANGLVATLLNFKSEGREPIKLYFNSPGGLLRPCCAVYDAMSSCKETAPVHTMNLGLASGMVSMLCGAGTRGRRFALPNARYLLQRVGMEDVFQGQATDIGLEVTSVKKANDRMERELAKMTGHLPEKIKADMKRDFYLSSDEAVRYGLIDQVLLPSGKNYDTQAYIEQNSFGDFRGEEKQTYQDVKGSGFGAKEMDDDDDDDDDYEPPLE
mmetsp:Transcript_29112/g.57872  ORF Transcript_29112/g.57872 Transcript_29112/m.57872 type:complete len:316 (+) Transcript_29112:210-1157(+)